MELSLVLQCFYRGFFVFIQAQKIDKWPYDVMNKIFSPITQFGK